MLFYPRTSYYYSAMIIGRLTVIGMTNYLKAYLMITSVIYNNYSFLVKIIKSKRYKNLLQFNLVVSFGCPTEMWDCV